MADGEHETLIIVRRHDDDEHEAHSSAWKVAHADFMTAMMAFFLIMWLINVTDEEIRKGISEYFNPVHLSQGQSEQKGLNRPEDAGIKETEEKGPSALPPEEEEGGDQLDPSAATAHEEKSAEEQHEAQGAPPSNGSGTLPNQGTGQAPVAVEPVGEAAERAAFQDPYATLAKLASAYDADHPAQADFVVGDDREPGVTAGEIGRDPFDPVYWQTSNGVPVRSAQPGSATSAERLPPQTRPDSMGPLTETVAAPPAAESARTPDAASPVEPEPAEATTQPEATEHPAVTDSAAHAAAVGAAIESAIRKTLGESSAPAITVKATDEGLLVDLTDDVDFSMFEIGSAIPNAKLVKIMEQIAKVLQNQEGAIVVRGHTDGRPFRSEVYDNWRLSAARAHMAYYMLVRGGLTETRFEKIEGYADRALKNRSEPYADQNRRIEILLASAGR